ncbi:4-hydroxy-tetrahydrodipicolinate synthase [Bienertia sinuspersici]
MRVMIDVRKPLKDEIKLKLRGGEVTKVHIKYERLPLICFICGCIGHNDRECEEYNEESSPIKKLGAWIRASPWKGKPIEEKGTKESKNVVSVFSLQNRVGLMETTKRILEEWWKHWEQST